MRTAILLSLFTLGLLAFAEGKAPVIPIKEFSETLDKSGAYKVKTVGADGQQVEEVGVMKDLGDKGGPVSVKAGEFVFPAKGGGVVREKWTSDERGFIAQGNALPTPPPIPLAIQKELKENRVKPPFGPGST